jgi:hypothetical protein
MKRIRFSHIAACIMLATIAACGDSGSSSAPPPPDPAPPEPTIIYSIQGKAVKGVISGATVSVVDGDGATVDSATTTSGSDGSYSIEFSTTDAVVEPIQIVLDGSGAATVCDVSPACEYGLDNDGNALVAGFGETYTLPDGFTLRATIASLTADGDDRSGTAFISPLSDFVTALALDMGSGTDLTVTNLEVANDKVIAFVKTIYPTLNVEQLTEISQVPLLDLTSLENSAPDDLTDVALAATSLSAAVAGFVDAQNSERGSIAQVMDEFNADIALNQEVEGVLLNEVSDTLLASQAVEAISDAVTELDELTSSGVVILPDGAAIDDLDTIRSDAEDALLEIINITTNLTPDELTADVQSSAVGRSELVLIPSNGQIIVSVEARGLTATAAHLHQGFAGANGPVIVALEQDPGNASRLSSPANTTIEQADIDAIMRGETYINVHTATNGGGELRGQVVPDDVLVVISRPNGEEVAPSQVSSSGFARAAVTLNETSNIAQVHLTTNLELTAAHVHSALAGTNGGVAVPLTLDASSTGHWFADDVDFSVLVGQFSGAELYFNLHTADHPAGELRAQVVPSNYQVLISTLDSQQVVSDEPIDSVASGVSAVTLNVETNTFSIHVNTTGVEDATGVHIHAGAAGVGGAVAFPLEQSLGDINRWSAENQMFTADQLVSFLDGGMYVNVHTPTYPAGEIRGQLTALAPGLGDSDGDGVVDREDAFPNDPSESVDSDGDGVGDNSDTFPNDPAEQADSDGDGVGDNADAFPENAQETVDTDGDGVGDNSDACPTDPAETLDSDGDGICDNSDPVDNSQDADGDGVNDSVDAFPNDPNESQDSDGDGVGDNADQFPNDSSETVDSDGDGVGDNGDAFPNDASESADSDADGVGDNADAFPNDASETTDTDGDGVGDNADAFPTDSTETVDTDGDGVGDNGDNCPLDANPGQENSDGLGAGDACESQSAPAYSEIQAIFDSRCVGCHGSSGGLTLTSSVSYNNLVNVPSNQMPSLDRVEPGDPDNSYLVWKIEGRTGITGSRMPLGGPFLSQETIDLIRSWISAGAPR